jgi:ADP-ribose pyrophosphatase
LSENIVFQGNIVEVVQMPQEDGRIFEYARRSPGVRLIVLSHDGLKLLLTREFRRENNGYDYRLPGGKVFDKLTEYNDFLASGKDIIEPATKRAIAEGAEETGLEIKELKHFVTAVNGTTMVWDLIYFVVNEWSELPSGQALEAGEDIEVDWYTIDEARQMLATGEMQEYRSAGVLTQWLSSI